MIPAINKVVLMATSVTQTRFDIGTESAELRQVLQPRDSMVPITWGLPNEARSVEPPKFRYVTLSLFAWTLEDRWDNLSIAVWQTTIKIDNLLLIWLMTINFDCYTTNYRHAAAYQTLIVKTTVYKKPFAFSIGLKESVNFIF